MDGSSGRWGLALTLATMVLSAAIVAAVPDLRSAVGNALGGDTDELRRDLRGTGAGGVALLVGLILVHAVVFYPAELVNASAGVAYGFGGAALIVVPAWLAANLAAFYVGRHAGRPVLLRLAGAERLARAEGVIERGGVRGLLVARLIPVIPMSLVGYVAGAARVRLAPFAWTTAIGTLPLTLAAVLLGSRIDKLSLTDPVLYVAIAPFVVLALVARPLARRFAQQ